MDMDIMDITPLITLKSKDPATQRAILDEFTRACLASPTVNLRKITDSDSLLGLTSEPTENIIRYCLLAIYAADVASVPYANGRERNLGRLRALTTHYDLNFDKVVRLTIFETALLEELQQHA
jgi:hypothetical protein